MNSMQIRKKFIDFFVKNGHQHVPSSSLIPAQDPTLLFANAGMNQFKDLFLGKEKRSYTRAVTIQKCMRAGGKHSDLDNVGFTKRHLTFFEMMGNFSFGDYFKKDAIRFAWNFLTQEIKFDPNVMYITVYKDDDESYNIWHTEIGVPEKQISRLGEADNFWQMGDTGPCGPCTEIYIDRGIIYGCGSTDCAPGCSCDRFLEVWNLVFMQYDRQVDGSDVPLKQTGVDTGMGIERLASVIQNVDSVFQTDLFIPIIERIEKLSTVTYKNSSKQIQAAFHVLADHIRSSTFLIADGCAPTNEGRGYVLRKIIRRAALFAQRLTDKNIFPDLADAVIDQMGSVYPELIQNKKLIKNVLNSEVEKFSTNLQHGNIILQDYLKQAQKTKRISGEQAFKLYDTYGFPLELAVAFAKEEGFSVDTEGFEALMEEQRERSGRKVADALDALKVPENITTEFTGYTELITPSKVRAIVKNDTFVDTVNKGDSCWILTEKSPFFIVGGGQVPDQGTLTFGNQDVAIQEVRFIDGRIAARIAAPVNITVGDAVISTVDKQWRINAMKNHTATHLLQAALIELFGKTIKQSGSLVHPDYLRFDFSYHENLSSDDIKKVEDIVNQKIRDNIVVDVEYMPMPEALKRGALAFFGDKYNPEEVRCVQISEFSAELCGGTHVPRTGDIGTFKIIEISALSAGHRRIVAVTGPKAIDLFQTVYSDVKTLSQEFKVKTHEVLDAVFKQKEQIRELQIELRQLKKEALLHTMPEWLSETEEIKDIPYLCKIVQGYAPDDLRDLATMLTNKKPGFYFLVNNSEEACSFIAMVSPEFSSKIDLKKFAAWLREAVQLRGGGKANIIQGGGPRVSSDLCEKIKLWLSAI